MCLNVYVYIYILNTSYCFLNPKRSTPPLTPIFLNSFFPLHTPSLCPNFKVSMLNFTSIITCGCNFSAAWIALVWYCYSYKAGNCVFFLSSPLGFTAGTTWPSKGSGKECLKKEWKTELYLKAVILIQKRNKLVVKEAIHRLLWRSCGLIHLWEKVVQKKVSLHCEPVRCLKLVNHGFPSKSEQEIHSESVKSVQALLCFMYVCDCTHLEWRPVKHLGADVFCRVSED